MDVAALAYVVLDSPTPGEWRTFLEKTVGLATASITGDGDFYRMDDAAWRINVRQADTERFAAAGISLTGDRALDACIARLRAGGHPCAEDPALAKARNVQRLVRTADPCGTPVELVVGRPLGYEHFVSPAGVSGFVADDMGLGHVVLPAPDIEAARAFWIEVIGLHLTDTMSFTLSEAVGPQKLYFMHAGNERHHSVGLFEAPSPVGLIHLMLEARTIDDVGRFIDRCADHGVHLALQLGRHSNDRMLSVYVVTPGGSMLEFGCDGLRIDPRTWIPTTSLAPDLWGHKFLGGPPDIPAI